MQRQTGGVLFILCKLPRMTGRVVLAGPGRLLYRVPLYRVSQGEWMGSEGISGPCRRGRARQNGASEAQVTGILVLCQICQQITLEQDRFPGTDFIIAQHELSLCRINNIVCLNLTLLNSFRMRVCPHIVLSQNFPEIIVCKVCFYNHRLCLSLPIRFWSVNFFLNKFCDHSTPCSFNHL